MTRDPPSFFPKSAPVFSRLCLGSDSVETACLYKPPSYLSATSGSSAHVRRCPSSAPMEVPPGKQRRDAGTVLGDASISMAILLASSSASLLSCLKTCTNVLFKLWVVRLPNLFPWLSIKICYFRWAGNVFGSLLFQIWLYN